MSGHSHAKTIKRVKDAHDAQRGRIFSKLARMISVAVREGANPETNSKLRQVLDEARNFNMPKDNVERAIKRGTGEIGGEKLESVSYEAFGPSGIAIIIEGITDNKNRTLSEVKQILQKYGGKLAGEGSVRWLFERKGAITLNLDNQSSITKDELELKAIEGGAENIYWHKTENILDVYTKPEELDKIKKTLEDKGLKIESTSLDWAAKEQIEVEEKGKESIDELFEELDESETVQDIYSNLKL